MPFSILHCRAIEAQLRQRVVPREAGGADASEANLQVLEHEFLVQEPLDDVERQALWRWRPRRRWASRRSWPDSLRTPASCDQPPPHAGGLFER
ncbi:hypothetical protein QTH97_22535 [Variovorax sp. J22R24]|uniref:hypothetical protein n=1 Tax=Variovorax gracilis TaxID=3053502 RepID=UPI0025768047|nr:hypothetical protein [Variovorax sp. J22R24]MDM0107741.1 hypothetical protein [Variovorax sp. J22R24]